MVDITSKDVTTRRATASAFVRMSSATLELVMSRSLEKGDVLEVARIAGIMGAKQTADLIPLCHPIGIGAVEMGLAAAEGGLRITSTITTAERTGVEMEALTAVTVAALTVYDMVKGVERGVEITDVRLLSKAGGRSGEWTRPAS